MGIFTYLRRLFSRDTCTVEVTEHDNYYSAYVGDEYFWSSDGKVWYEVPAFKELCLQYRYKTSLALREVTRRLQAKLRSLRSQGVVIWAEHKQHSLEYPLRRLN